MHAGTVGHNEWGACAYRTELLISSEGPTPGRDGHIHRGLVHAAQSRSYPLGACACTNQDISTRGPVNAPKSRSYLPEVLCIARRARHTHLGACACRTELVISNGGLLHGAQIWSYPTGSLRMPRKAGHIHQRAFACRTHPVV